MFVDKPEDRILMIAGARGVRYAVYLVELRCLVKKRALRQPEKRGVQVTVRMGASSCHQPTIRSLSHYRKSEGKACSWHRT